MAKIGTDINRAKALLTAGELVAIPTETVYGLAGNALDAHAVTKIFAAKERPEFNPLIIHVPSLETVGNYVENIPEKAARLANTFWPGPLTLILPRKKIIPDLVTAGLETVGVRCPDHELTRTLLTQLSFPLAAPSANPFGYVSPTTAQHVNEQLGDKIAYILDGGPCKVGLESTIVGIENNRACIYRLGGLGIEAIEAIIGSVLIQLNSSSNPKSPGQLKSHYAPSRKMIIGKLQELLQEYPAHCSAILSFQDDYNSPYQFILAPSGNLEEAAQNLFTALRTLDKLSVDVILAEPVPDTGLGRAINDRLRRASVKMD